MAITYHAGRRIQGLSTDKLETLTLDDNLSTQHAGWTANSSDITYDSGNGRINYSADGTVGYQYKALDLQHANFLNGSNLSDSKFLCRFKLVITSTNINSNSEYNEALFGLSSLDNAPNLEKDFLGFYIRNFGNNERWYNAQSVNNGSILGGGQAFNTVVSTGTYYIEIIRMSETQFTVEIFNADTYATGASVEKETVTISSSIQSLRFFYVGIGRQAGETGSNQGYIDDIKIYNGVTSLTSKPTNVQIGSRFEETDTRKIYFFKDPLVFEDDFTSYADQASADAVWARSSINNIVNVSTDKIDFNFKRATNARISKDLGVGNISNTAWVLRMKLRFSALSGNNKVLTISLNTTDYNTARNGTQTGLGCVIASGASQTGLNGSTANSSVLGATGSYIGTFTINTDYYLEIKRLSATTASAQIFSDSGYTTLTHNTGIFVISSAITGLRYLKILDDNTFDVYDDTGLGTIDDIKFYNGVTTISNYWTEEA